jgi:hypothetical protein
MSSLPAAVPEELRRRLEEERVEFRALQLGDLTDAVAEEMLGLFQRNFDRWPYLDPGVPPIDYLRWKVAGPATRFAALDGRQDGRLIFAATTFANWMRIAGERRLRIVVPDICVDRSVQGRGLFSLSAAVRPYLPGYSGDLSLHEQSATRRNERALARKGQTMVANRVTSWFRILRPMAWQAHRGRLAEAPLAAAAWVIGTLAATRRRDGSAARRGRPTLTATGLTDPARELDARFDALFEEAAPSFDAISERGSEHLRWRYGDRRAGPFVPRVIVEGGRLLGFAVLRPATPRAYLADLLAVPDRPDVVEALIADQVGLARRAGAAGIECWLPERHPYRAPLRRLGFFDSRRDAGIQYHAVDVPASALRVLEDPLARFHYTIGDTDVV